MRQRNVLGLYFIVLLFFWTSMGIASEKVAPIEQEIEVLVSLDNSEAAFLSTIEREEIGVLASLDNSDAAFLSTTELEDVRGEEWSFGLYVKGAVSGGVPGINIGYNAGYKWNITDKNGKYVGNITIKTPLAKKLDVKNGSAALGIGLNGEKILVNVRATFGAGLVGEVGAEFGKMMNLVDNYFVEFLAGGGVGAAAGGKFKINGYTISPEVNASATAGVWIRSQGTPKQILSDFLSSTKWIIIPPALITSLKKY